MRFALFIIAWLLHWLPLPLCRPRRRIGSPLFKVLKRRRHICLTNFGDYVFQYDGS